MPPPAAESRAAVCPCDAHASTLASVHSPESAHAWAAGGALPAAIVGVVVALMALVAAVGACCHRRSRRRRERNRDRRNASLRKSGAQVVRDVKSAFPNPPPAHSDRRRPPPPPAAVRGASWHSHPDAKGAWGPVPDVARKLSAVAVAPAVVAPSSPASAAAISKWPAPPPPPPVPAARRPLWVSSMPVLAPPAARRSPALPPPPPPPAAESPAPVPVAPGHAAVYAAAHDPVAASLALPAHAISTSDGPAPCGGYYDEPGATFAGYAEYMFSVRDERAAIDRVRSMRYRACDGGADSPPAFPYAGYLARPSSTASGVVQFAGAPPDEQRGGRKIAPGGGADGADEQRQGHGGNAEKSRFDCNRPPAGAGFAWTRGAAPDGRERCSSDTNPAADAGIVTPMDILTGSAEPHRVSARACPEPGRLADRRPSMPSDIVFGWSRSSWSPSSAWNTRQTPGSSRPGSDCPNAAAA